MGNTVKIALISGFFGLAGAVVANLDKFQSILRDVGVHAATHVLQVSESPPASTLCDDEGDLGRIIIHSASDGRRAIFFCPQGPKSENYRPIGWYVAKGVPLTEYKSEP